MRRGAARAGGGGQHQHGGGGPGGRRRQHGFTTTHAARPTTRPWPSNHAWQLPVPVQYHWCSVHTTSPRRHTRYSGWPCRRHIGRQTNHWPLLAQSAQLDRERRDTMRTHGHVGIISGKVFQAAAATMVRTLALRWPTPAPVVRTPKCGNSGAHSHPHLPVARLPLPAVGVGVGVVVPPPVAWHAVRRRRPGPRRCLQVRRQPLPLVHHRAANAAVAVAGPSIVGGSHAFMTASAPHHGGSVRTGHLVSGGGSGGGGGGGDGCVSAA